MLPGKAGMIGFGLACSIFGFFTLKNGISSWEFTQQAQTGDKTLNERLVVQKKGFDDLINATLCVGGMVVTSAGYSNSLDAYKKVNQKA
jgi:hypothetical protein